MGRFDNGERVGEKLGDKLGFAELGLWLGFEYMGDRVGARDGLPVGEAEGRLVGNLDGRLLGEYVEVPKLKVTGDH